MPPLFGRGNEPRSEEQQYKRLEKLQNNLDEQYRNQISENNELRETNAQLRVEVARLDTELKNLNQNSFRAFVLSIIALILSNFGVGLMLFYLTSDEKEILILVMGSILIILTVIIEILAYTSRS